MTIIIRLRQHRKQFNHHLKVATDNLVSMLCVETQRGTYGAVYQSLPTSNNEKMNFLFRIWTLEVGYWILDIGYSTSPTSPPLFMAGPLQAKLFTSTRAF